MFNHRVRIPSRHRRTSKTKSSTNLSSVNYLREFSSITSLHGIMYLGEPKRPLLERIFWLCVMSLVVSLCGWLTYQLYGNWSSSRMILTINTNAFKATDIPFPAITFCSDLQLMNISNRTAKDNKEINDAINLLCNKYNVQANATMKFIDAKSWQHVIKNYKVPCQHIISKLFWLQDEIHSPCDYIQPTITSYGFCYSLNMIPHRHFYEKHYFQTMDFLNRTQSENIFQKNESIWTPENHYSVNATPFDIPWKVAENTIENAVRLVFNLKNTNLGGHCPETDTGVTLIVHNPSNTPIGMEPTAYVTRNSVSSISLSIFIVRTSPKIKSWPPKKRNCYLQNEKSLKFFKIYTLHNCEVECKANNTLKECGCNAYFQPRDPGVPVCGSNSLSCVRESTTIGYSIFDKQLKTLKNNMEGCECLHSCIDIRYDFKTVNYFKNWTANSTSSNINGDKSVVMAYYKSKSVIDIQNIALMPFSDLLGNIGGLFGLFLGCSIISFFEIVYFFVIRLYFNHRDQRIAKSKIMPSIILDE